MAAVSRQRTFIGGLEGDLQRTHGDRQIAATTSLGSRTTRQHFFAAHGHGLREIIKRWGGCVCFLKSAIEARDQPNNGHPGAYPALGFSLPKTFNQLIEP